MANEPLTGLQRVRKACIEARGGQWCDEHASDRYDCRRQHPTPPAYRDSPVFAERGACNCSTGAPGGCSAESDEFFGPTPI